MDKIQSLERFIDAQKNSYSTALAEIRRGRKQSHWMWWIFPQIRGLATSQTAQFYAIINVAEAKQFLQHPVLGKRLQEIWMALLELQNNNASEILGYPDDVKLKSCITLFAAANSLNPFFKNVLLKFFEGKRNDTTLAIIKRDKSDTSF